MKEVTKHHIVPYLENADSRIVCLCHKNQHQHIQQMNKILIVNVFLCRYNLFSILSMYMPESWDSISLNNGLKPLEAIMRTNADH